MVIVTGRKCVNLAVGNVALELKLNSVFDSLDNLFSVLFVKLNNTFYFITHKYYLFNNEYIIN